MTEHIQTRRKVFNISGVKTFNELLDSCTLSDDEKALMRMHYIEKKDFRFIGDMLGYSEVTMKRWHQKILKKLNKLI